MELNNNDKQFQDFSNFIFFKNYALKGETSREELFGLVANRIASNELTPEASIQLEKDINEIFNNGEATGGGRIMANARPLDIQTENNYMNCFTIDMEDSLEKILDSIHDHGMISKGGGGVGMDVSKIRPKNSSLSTGGIASGPISFLEIVNVQSAVIVVGGGRRSANIALLDISHPDIEEFITYKQGDINKRLKMFNISVKVSDAFMNAVDEDLDWDLTFNDKIHKTLRARDLWDKIIKHSYTHNEPGIFNSDTIERYNNGWYKIKLSSVNPCTEFDTEVAVADGRGKVKMGILAQEGKDVPVYCLNNEGKTVIRMMRNPRITGYNKKLLKVTFDDGSFIRRTENHQIRMKDGEYKRLDELEMGDSIYIGIRGKFKWNDFFKKSNSKSKEYIMMNDKLNSKMFEHHLIWEFYHDKKISKGHVIHHIDLDPTNNRIDNLQIMIKKEHDTLHAELMKGELNPYYQMTDEWKRKFATHHGESNGRYTGHTTNELFEVMINWIKENDKFISYPVWSKIAKENGYPQAFTKFRGSLTNLLNRANLESHLPSEIINPFHRREYNRYTDLLKTSDLDLKFIDGSIYVEKKCEECSDILILNYNRREIGFCPSCSKIRLTKKLRMYKGISVSNLQKATMVQSDIKKNIRETKFNTTMSIFQEFVTSKLRIPTSTDMIKLMKEKDINDFRSLGLKGYINFLNKISKKYNINTHFHIFSGRDIATSKFQAKMLLENGLVYNHKVVSIEEDGYETVYNGTVDDFHNFNSILNDKRKSPITGRERWDIINDQQCGELILPPNSSCNLGVLYLSKFIENKFTEGASFNYSRLKKVIHIMIRSLDNLVDLTVYPIKEIKEMSLAWRRLGLGITGLGNVFAMMRVKYGSKESEILTHSIFSMIRDESYRASIQLAKEKGTFPEFDKDRYLLGHFIKTLPEDIQKGIAQHGIRNVQINTIAPTGTTSVAFGNYCSSGIEPTFELEFDRTVQINGIDEQRRVHDAAWLDYKKFLDLPSTVEIAKPDWFSLNDELTIADHINIQAIAQKYIDHSISKTINIPPGTSYEEYKDTYMLAYKSGLKGITTYNPEGSMKGILGRKESSILSEVPERPEYLEAKLHSFTHFSSPGVSERIVILLGFLDDYIFESFVLKDPDNIFPTITESEIPYYIHKWKSEAGKNQYDLKTGRNAESSELLMSSIGIFKPAGNNIGRMISSLLRIRYPLQVIVAQLTKDAVINDFEASLARALQIYIKNGEIVDGDTCPECGSGLAFKEGCKECTKCGWVKCG